MTAYELAARDLRSVEINLFRARKKPNVTQFELERLEEQYELRKVILEKLTENNDSWVRKPDGSCSCSACNRDANRDGDSWILTEFCPHCGAAMNGNVIE